jgi:hypothetical protein
MASRENCIHFRYGYGPDAMISDLGIATECFRLTGPFTGTREAHGLLLKDARVGPSINGINITGDRYFSGSRGARRLGIAQERFERVSAVPVMRPAAFVFIRVYGAPWSLFDTRAFGSSSKPIRLSPGRS